MGKITSYPPIDRSSAPFIRILPAVILGIIVGNWLHIGMWTAMAGFAVTTAVTWAVREREPANWVMTYVTIIMVGVASRTATMPETELPVGERIMMTLCVTDTPQKSGDQLRTTARVLKYKTLNPSGDWQRSGEKVTLYFRGSDVPEPGTKITATGRTNNPTKSSWRTGRRVVWADASGIVTLERQRGFALRRFASRLQARAYAKLMQLDLTPKTAAIAAAMSIGIRNDFPIELRNDYNRTGTSHLQAVSGLHVGIVALLVNVLLSFMSTFRGGHIAKNIIAILVIWLYALVTGMRPSIVRAAMMFSGFQASLISSRRIVGSNIFFATATIMLLLNPDYLTDIGFQLSFAAVTGIIYLYPPLFDAVKTRLRVINSLLKLFITGLAATVAVTPILSYHFGSIPIIGVLISPVLIATASVVMFGTLLWVTLPLAPLNKFFSLVIGSCAHIQNSMTEVCASKSWCSLPIRLEAWEVLLVYAAIAMLLAAHSAKSTSRLGKIFEPTTAEP